MQQSPNTQDIAQKIVEGITDAMEEISEGKESSLNSVFANMRILKQYNLPSVGPSGFTSLFEALSLEDKRDFDIYQEKNNFFPNTQLTLPLYDSLSLSCAG